MDFINHFASYPNFLTEVSLDPFIEGKYRPSEIRILQEYNSHFINVRSFFSKNYHFTGKKKRFGAQPFNPMLDPFYRTWRDKELPRLNFSTLTFDFSIPTKQIAQNYHLVCIHITFYKSNEMLSWKRFSSTGPIPRAGHFRMKFSAFISSMRLWHGVDVSLSDTHAN